MSVKQTVLKGTVLLTAAGMISRLIGFYYRIFLTRIIGAEGIGIYQLVFPIYALCFSLTSAGIQTVVSRLVAANDTSGISDQSLVHTRIKNQFHIFYVGLFLSVTLAIAASAFVYVHADWISQAFIGETRCQELLKILALSVPLGAVHSVINGYYLGIKKAVLPAVCQLVEQVVRVSGVFVIVLVLQEKHQLITAEVAVWGIVLGEIASSLLSFTSVKLRQSKWRASMEQSSVKITFPLSRRTILSTLVRQSIPLTLNRLAINMLQSLEAVLIPSMLRMHGLNTAQSLSTYGILTGMALPLVLFPSAITNSVSVMLLPVIAHAQAEQKTASIEHAVEKSMKYCLLLGIFCTGIFLELGTDMGMVLFHNDHAGKYIVTLAWICPFLYITSTLGSVVHGLGKTLIYFIFNSFSLLIRIGFVLLCIPEFGILGYLWGVLASQLVMTCFLWMYLRRVCRPKFPWTENIIFPVMYLIISLFAGKLIDPLLGMWNLHPVMELTLHGMTITAVYGGLAIYGGSL